MSSYINHDGNTDNNITPWIHFTKCLWAYKLKFHENSFCCNFYSNDWIRSHFCTRHNSWAVMACAKLWSSLIIIICYDSIKFVFKMWIMSSWTTWSCIICYHKTAFVTYWAKICGDYIVQFWLATNSSFHQFRKQVKNQRNVSLFTKWLLKLFWNIWQLNKLILLHKCSSLSHQLY